MMGMDVLTTRRLRLRRMVEDDIDNLLQIFSDPVAMQYYPRTRSRSEVETWVQWTLRNYAVWGIGMWIVEDDAGTFLGQCGLNPQEIHSDVPEIEIGYLFVRRFWGYGYATEAARACCNWGMAHLDTSHLISIISPKNHPSIAVAHRNGMAWREDTLWKGHSVSIYSITREMWREFVDKHGAE
jgi:RimJ/RimL family protein N-acetyltransferase